MPTLTATPGVDPPQPTKRIFRAIRWSRMLTHVAVGLVVVGSVFPRVSVVQRAAFTRWWANKLLRILNILLLVQGDKPPLHTANLIIAANHTSWIDVFVINAVQPARFIAKAEIRDWPIAGWLAEKAGTIFIRRTRRRDTAKINDTTHSVLAEGSTVGFFPEGTTTAGDKLLKFHTSLFEPAVINSAMIAPVAIRYRDSGGEPTLAAAFIGELSFAESISQIIAMKSMIAEIRFAPPIAAAGANRRTLAVEAEAAIANMLGVAIPHAHQRFTDSFEERRESP